MEGWRWKMKVKACFQRDCVSRVSVLWEKSQKIKGSVRRIYEWYSWEGQAYREHFEQLSLFHWKMIGQTVLRCEIAETKRELFKRVLIYFWFGCFPERETRIPVFHQNFSEGINENSSTFFLGMHIKIHLGTPRAIRKRCQNVLGRWIFVQWYEDLCWFFFFPFFQNKIG